jgi:transposase
VARRFVQVRTRVARACRAEPHARSNQKFEHAAQQIVFQEEIDSIEDAVQRLRRLEKQLALSPGGTLDRRYNPTEGPHLAGNRRARRALIEAAWTYRYPARVTETLRARLEALPKPVRNIAWKAQIRLCARYRRLSAKGKKLPVVVAAIAREIAALLWAIGREVAPA